VPRDFVEAPSQMLENWAWDKSVLDTFAADYRDPSKKNSGGYFEQAQGCAPRDGRLVLQPPAFVRPDGPGPAHGNPRDETRRK